MKTSDVIMTSALKPIKGVHWPSGLSVRLQIGRPGFDPRRGRCVVALSKRYLLPKSTGNTQEKVAPSQHD